MDQGLIGVAGFAFRVLLGLVFLRAGLAKLRNRKHFVTAVANYGILGPTASELVGRWLPPTETILAVLLLLGIAQTWVATLLGALLLAFGVAVSWNLIQGRVIDCGCRGPGAPKQITWWTVARNFAFIGVAAIVVTRPSNILSLTNSGGQVMPLGVAASQGIAITIAAIALVLLERLAREAMGARKSLRRLSVVRDARPGSR